MNPGTPSQNTGQLAAGGTASSGFNLDDVLFTLFRHKWLILGFFCLAIAAVAGVRLFYAPMYVSKAKLMVHYVTDSRPVNPGDPDRDNVHPLDTGAMGIIAAQIEILTSFDVATQAVYAVGAEKILAKVDGGNDPLAAAVVVAEGTEVDPPRSAILTISFKHPDGETAQLVLAALMDTYMRKHVAVHQRIAVLDAYYTKVANDLRERLKQTEEDLKRVKTEANVLFPDEGRTRQRFTKLQDDLFDAERELAEHKAVLSGMGSAIPNTLESTNTLSQIPNEVLADYTETTTDLEKAKRDERELLRTYTKAYPSVQRIRAQIDKLSLHKADLETNYPSLNYLFVSSPRAGTTNSANEVTTEMAEIRRLTARVMALTTVLSNMQAEAMHVMQYEPRIAELQRRRDEEQKRYEFAVQSLEATQEGETRAAGKANNISIVQTPTPPGPDLKKLKKILAGVFAAVFGLGVGLAFLKDMLLDRTIKRASDVLRHMRIPVFLTIPDTGWRDRPTLPWPLGRKKEAEEEEASERSELIRWEPQPHLQTWSAGLRERLMTYFEVRDMNHKKPKLVAVAGCNRGAGASTLASGLAAELSKTGDGNVLLVDMNGEQGMAHPFHWGKPGCGLSEALEPDGMAEAQVESKLYVASLKGQDGQPLSPVLPSRFSQMMPKLQAADYDYIIFDMPTVTPTSSTPRLASHMDLVLLVLESEKTAAHSAARATSLMRESRVNVAAVLNKYRPHLPAQLSQDM
jgi:uncharacterized protein involved in exopolysaccharide biosynthesis/Mrp family chromosome partitioning ATPase